MAKHLNSYRETSRRERKCSEGWRNTTEAERAGGQDTSWQSD